MTHDGIEPGTMKNPIEDQTKDLLSRLDTLRDEAKVKLHLAGLELKSEWNRLEPELDKVRDAAREATDASKKALEDSVHKLEGLLKRAS